MKHSFSTAKIWRLGLLLFCVWCVLGNDAANACPDPTVYVNIATGSSGSESVTTKQVSVTLTASSSLTITVPFSINVSSTATGGGTDYSISSSPLTFSPGETSKNITLTINNDSLDENDEIVVIDLGTPTNATLGTTISSTYTINDDDNPPSAYIATSCSGSESVSSKTVAVTLTAASGKTISVPFNINAQSTATGGGTDYSISSSPLTFNAGETSKNITLAITGDSLDENDETVMIDLGSPTNATLGSPSSFTYTIQDDDPTPSVSISQSSVQVNEGSNAVLTVQLSAASGRSVTVPFSVGAQSTAGGSDYTISSSPLVFSPGQTQLNITVGTTQDSLDEPDETVIVNLGSPTNAGVGSPSSSTITILDDDPAPTVSISPGGSGGESVATKTIAVVLSAASGRTITVPFSVNGSSTATGGGTDYSISSSPLTFNAGETSKNITLTINNDSLDENDESVMIDLGVPTNATLGSPSSSTFTITDDDQAPEVSIEISTSGDESVITKTVTVVLSAASGKTVTVPFSINASSTATGGGVDFALEGSSPFTFTPGQTSLAIMLTINSDEVDELDETITIDLGSPTNVTLGSPSSFTYTILDDDLNAPTNLSVVANDATDPTRAMRVEWLDNSLGETDFLLERSPNGQDQWTAIIISGQAGTGSVVYIDYPPLVEGTHYWYRVQARLQR